MLVPALATAKLDDQLAQGLSALGLGDRPLLQEKLLAYVALLVKWNRAYNLTAVREPTDMVTRHLLDSLAILPFLQLPTVLDIGTGPGLPGIPLALFQPEGRFTLLDSNSKKTRFVNQAVMELGLSNVTVVQSRIEGYEPKEQFTTVVSRAFSTIQTMLEACQHVCAEGGRIIAMKGQYPTEELTGWPEGFRLVSVEPLLVPGLEAERHAVLIEYEGDR